MSTYVLYGNPGWGLAIVEAQLAWYGLPFRFEQTGDLFASQAARETLRSLDPISQVPTLVLPDGQVMTESVAITLHLADLSGRDDLVPGPAAAQRAASSAGWSSWWPTHLCRRPVALLQGRGRACRLSAQCDAYAQRLWLAVEAAAGAPWFLSQRLSALDLYFAVMTRWRPRRGWFAAHARASWPPASELLR